MVSVTAAKACESGDEDGLSYLRHGDDGGGDGDVGDVGCAHVGRPV